jgi:GTP cyclohydrolase II
MLVTWVMSMLMRMLMLCHLLLQFVTCSYSESLLLDTLILVTPVFSEENRMHLICVLGSKFHTYDRLMSVISQDIAQNVQKRFINFYYTHEGRLEGLYTNNDIYEYATPSSSSTGF